MTDDNRYFFCGIGGSGMLPLATLLAAQGATIAGSDRALDHGRSEAKFDWLRGLGISLFPQDGSGVTSSAQTLVASAAVEETVPDVAAARAHGCARLTRAELLARLFNAAATGIAIGGTSGKSTVTGMTGWILTATGRDPAIMNGAVMRNFAGLDAPFASARIGAGSAFVSEVDESDGSIALFRPAIALVTNITLDHKPMAELRGLFGAFLADAQHALWNADDPESRAVVADLASAGRLGNAVSFGFAADADVRAEDVELEPLASRFTVAAGGERVAARLGVPGRHNIANALAALAAARAAGVPLADAITALAGYRGLARRFEVVGEAGGVAVIDDFGHNPDKIAATLATLKAFPGRVIAFFQPHGYGPLKLMGQELAATFAAGLDAGDALFLCDPVYFGGTVDRSVGSDTLAAMVNGADGVPAHHIADRAGCGDAMLAMARPGDRIVVMGARDDSLSDFARDLVARLGGAKAS